MILMPVFAPVREDDVRPKRTRDGFETFLHLFIQQVAHHGYTSRSIENMYNKCLASTDGTSTYQQGADGEHQHATRRVAVAAGVSSVSSQAKPAAKKLDIAYLTAPPESGATGLRFMAEEVTKRSNGAINMVFHGGTLLNKELEIMDAVIELNADGNWKRCGQGPPAPPWRRVRVGHIQEQRRERCFRSRVLARRQQIVAMLADEGGRRLA